MVQPEYCRSRKEREIWNGRTGESIEVSIIEKVMV
jgi:hypothetical protein